MPLQATSGAASYDSFGGGVPVVPTYIEEVFSTYLYTGTGATQTITNNIDLSTKGGIVWCKGRSAAGYSNVVYDTINGANKRTATNLTNPLTTAASSLTAFNTTGFSLGADAGGEVNENAINYVSWTLRKQPKFFDVVTYSGTGSARTVAHSLGSAVGCIFIKAISGTGADSEGWRVYHRSQGATKYAMLQSTNAFATASSVWNDTEPTSTNFTVGTDTGTNGSGLTYIAYIFAHDAGGFGLTGTDNVISCGSFTTSGSGVATVTLGYEPQWLLIKSASGTSGWDLIDNMRGMPNLGTYGDAIGLEANNSNAEGSRFPNCYPTATGFYYGRAASTTYIYIAIRRGPMKVPTSGTSVFAPALGTSASTIPTFVTNFPVDLGFYHSRANTADWFLSSRLQGGGTLNTNTTLAEAAPDANYAFDSNTGWGKNFNSDKASSNFRRAPSFFDEVCYTGTKPTPQNLSHNLGVAPELIIVKRRSGTARDWIVYAAAIGNGNTLYLNLSNGSGGDTNAWAQTSPTSSVFTVGDSHDTNGAATTNVAYLFSTCAGVSKCTSFTGTGTLQTIDCGFTAGSRFVLIKRTDSTGDWYVWDSSRGLSSSTDPYLLLNSTAAEVTSTNWVDTTSTGFQVTAASGNNVNINGASYIALAIA